MARRAKKRSNRTGSLRLRGKKWVAQWMERGERKTKTFGDDKLRAETELKIILAKVAQGQPGLEPSARAAGTMADLVETWLENRANRTAYDDRNRWENHWLAHLGALGPDEVTVAVVKNCFIRFRAAGLSNATIRHCAVLLSGIYGDLVEEGRAKLNPIRQLSKKTRTQFLRPEHDPKKVPFVRDTATVLAIYNHLKVKTPSIAIAYAVAAFAGLRTSEVRALCWAQVDLTARTITIDRQVQRKTGKRPDQLTADGLDQVKDEEGRIVPIYDTLYPLLLEHHASRTSDLVAPAMKGQSRYKNLGGGRRFIGERILNRVLRAALVELGIEPELAKSNMCFYQGGRHTFASQWVLAGGSLEKLREFMGHSSSSTTERYVHLIPGQFTAEDRGRVRVPEPEERAPAIELSVETGAVLN